jgi:hypothetical protein
MTRRDGSFPGVRLQTVCRWRPLPSPLIDRSLISGGRPVRDFVGGSALGKRWRSGHRVGTHRVARFRGGPHARDNAPDVCACEGCDGGGWA